MSSRIDKKRAARERVAAMRREQQGRERRQRFAWITGIGLVVAVLVAVGAWGITRADKPAALPPVKAASGTTLPPWPLPADPAGKAKAAGLRVAAMEGTARHFHVHLDVIANGKQVAGDPSQIELLPHREIALVYGPATAKVTIPATYKFAPGE